MITYNEVPVVPTIFPDKTSQVWKIQNLNPNTTGNRIKWVFESEAEIMHMMQLNELLYYNGISCILDLPMFPYARQDKEVSNTATFAKKVFVHFLNSLTSVLTINTYDVHSSKYHGWLHINLTVLYPHDELAHAMAQTGSNLVCYPDNGATEKYKVVYPYKYISGSKVRDQNTGHITSYTLNGNPAYLRILIVDDICDGGATFILLAKELLARGAESVSLFVTHGIFSKGKKVLRDAGITNIFHLTGGSSDASLE